MAKFRPFRFVVQAYVIDEHDRVVAGPELTFGSTPEMRADKALEKYAREFELNLKREQREAEKQVAAEAKAANQPNRATRRKARSPKQRVAATRPRPLR